MQHKQKVSTQKNSKIPYIFFVFFAFVIAVNLGYIYIAKKTWRGVTTDEAYQKGLDYNETLKQAEKQKELGWQVDIRPTRMGKNKILLTIKILDERSSSVKDAEVTINFRRPTQEGFDFSTVASNAEGNYLSNVEFPLQGQWEATIIISHGEDKLYLARRYVIQ